MAKVAKRANFDLSPEQEAQILELKARLGAATLKEAVLRATNVTALLAEETFKGNRLYVGRSPERASRLILAGLERPNPTWEWLTSREHPWRRQLWVKGRRMPASAVWGEMRTNGLSVEQAADNWDLPIAAVEEICAYCEANAQRIAAEAAEEAVRLKQRGVELEAAAR